MKVVLVIDMPKNCLQCQILCDYRAVTDKCPLKPLPQKRTDNTFDGIYDFGLAKENDGWNACIDTILKENKEDE